ncbi:hypothetical protein LX32DRAFT_372523 [Colletotrichum zoysiae]|uniref:Uncharacterized protein n=1 Tax=Colletotrichum zoysiae TaxID=1216348 RepID=A0AAD9HUS0_9PEZI|nr:hypothetical protein LX32DRAFT_372523 [Colletotrichum zoysiae]
MHPGSARHRKKHTFMVLSASGSPGETKIKATQSASDIVRRGISHRRRQSCISRPPIGRSLRPPYTLTGWGMGRRGLRSPSSLLRVGTEASHPIAGGPKR